MRGAPHSGFATLISRMSWRISSGVLGRPPRGLDFQRHQARNPARCHLDDGLRLEDFHRVQHLGSQLIEPRKHQAIDIADGNPLGRLTPQHIELITRYPSITVLPFRFIPFSKSPASNNLVRRIYASRASQDTVQSEQQSLENGA
jgi:hypothetical protein